MYTHGVIKQAPYSDNAEARRGKNQQLCACKTYIHVIIQTDPCGSKDWVSLPTKRRPQCSSIHSLHLCNTVPPANVGWVEGCKDKGGKVFQASRHLFINIPAHTERSSNYKWTTEHFGSGSLTNTPRHSWCQPTYNALDRSHKTDYGTADPNSPTDRHGHETHDKRQAGSTSKS